ncbi:unnamed protein product [Pleuronectes platessa]|uniref:Uncharacterized protein n=1 Tax=Pleuronectes platessa TaxID=8262 RepID=A0A9N7Z5I4_PLEPL|nr:unnamed protein product [Pleuronectes platessa]
MSVVGLSCWTGKKDTRQKISGSIPLNPIPPAEVSLGKKLNAKWLPTAGGVWITSPHSFGLSVRKLFPSRLCPRLRNFPGLQNLQMEFSDNWEPHSVLSKHGAENTAALKQIKPLSRAVAALPDYGGDRTEPTLCEGDYGLTAADREPNLRRVKRS